MVTAGGDGRLLPSSSRGPAAVVAVAGAAVVAGPAVAVAHTTTPGALDASLARWAVDLFAGHHALGEVLAGVGGPVPVVAATAVLTLLFLVARRPRAAVLALLAPLVTALLVEEVLKPLVGRTLDGDLCYPSGHAACSSVVIGVVALGGRAATGRGRRTGPAVLTTVVAALVVVAALGAVALVAEHYHYATDVLAGVGAGVTVVVLLAATIDCTWPRRHHFPDSSSQPGNLSRERRFQP